MIPEVVHEEAVARFEEPDIWYSKFTIKGEVGLVATQMVIPRAQELFDSRRDMYWIHNYGEAVGVSAEARTWMQEAKIVLRPYAFVLCGGSFRVRTVFYLIVRAMRLMGRFEGKMVTFNTEEEARAWIERDRVQRVAKSA